MMINVIAGRSIILRIVGGLAIAAMTVLAGCAMTPEEKAADNMDRAAMQMQDAYNSMETVEKDLSKNKEGAAERAFNKAIEHMDNATVYYTKAVTTPAQKTAVQDLQSGLDQLEACVKSLENNDTVSAQAQYDKAEDYLNKASVELWATS